MRIILEIISKLRDLTQTLKFIDEYEFMKYFQTFNFELWKLYRFVSIKIILTFHFDEIFFYLSVSSLYFYWLQNREFCKSSNLVWVFSVGFSVLCHELETPCIPNWEKKDVMGRWKPWTFLIINRVPWMIFLAPLFPSLSIYISVLYTVSSHKHQQSA